MDRNIHSLLQKRRARIHPPSADQPQAARTIYLRSTFCFFFQRSRLYHDDGLEHVKIAYICTLPSLNVDDAEEVGWKQHFVSMEGLVTDIMIEVENEEELLGGEFTVGVEE